MAVGSTLGSNKKLDDSEVQLKGCEINVKIWTFPTHLFNWVVCFSYK